MRCLINVVIDVVLSNRKHLNSFMFNELGMDISKDGKAIVGTVGKK